MINLVNVAGPHEGNAVYEDIPAVGPLQVTIRVEKAPQTVMHEPLHQPMSFNYKDGKIFLTVPKLSIHDILVVE